MSTSTESTSQSRKSRRFGRRWPLIALSACCISILFLSSIWAPEMLSSVDSSKAMKSPFEVPPFGTDTRGRPLWEYLTQGAKIVLLPSILAGVLVSIFGTLGGLLRCVEWPRVSILVQGFSELIGALPRMVVILVAAIMVPRDLRSLYPLAVVWAVLAAPSAMDEAGAVASRLGGSRFVEALRAHGFSAYRIYFNHIVSLNLRPVVVRQGAETMMHVVFLEVALSYFAVVQEQASFTHSDSVHSWADLLRMGYTGLVFDVPTTHALVLGLALIGLVVTASTAISKAAGGR